MLCVCLVPAWVSHAGAPAMPAEDQEKARKLYVAKCAKCHKFHEPKQYTEAQWADWMKSMGRKSKLSAEQQQLLVDYLGRYRAGELPGRPQDKARSK